VRELFEKLLITHRNRKQTAFLFDLSALFFTTDSFDKLNLSSGYGRKSTTFLFSLKFFVSLPRHSLAEKFLRNAAQLNETS